MTIQDAIASVCAKRDLYAEEMIAVMRLVMTGEATDAQIGALLMGLRMKGETIDEIVGAASVMREFSQKWMCLKNFLSIQLVPVAMVRTYLTYPQHRHLLWLPQVVELRNMVTVRSLPNQDQQMCSKLPVFV